MSETPIEYEQFTGSFGARVDGWWQPEKGAMLEGIVVGFIPRERSDRLKSDNLVIELLGPTKLCFDNKADKVFEGKKGQNIGVPVWKQLEGIYPSKLGHAVKLTMTGETKLTGKSPMKDFDVKSSTKPLRKISQPVPETGSNGETGRYDV